MTELKQCTHKEFSNFLSQYPNHVELRMDRNTVPPILIYIDNTQNKNTVIGNVIYSEPKEYFMKSFEGYDL